MMDFLTRFTDEAGENKIETGMSPQRVYIDGKTLQPGASLQVNEFFHGVSKVTNEEFVAANLTVMSGAVAGSTKLPGGGYGPVELHEGDELSIVFDLTEPRPGKPKEESKAKAIFSELAEFTAAVLGVDKFELAKDPERIDTALKGESTQYAGTVLTLEDSGREPNNRGYYRNVWSNAL